MASFLKRLLGGSTQPIAAVPTSTPLPDAEPQPVAAEATAAPSEPAVDTPPPTVAAKNTEPPKSDTTGVFITGQVITVGGDIIGGHKYGDYRDAAAIDAALDPIEQEIEQNVPADRKIEALRQLYTIGEWAKRYEPDLVAVGKAIQWLATQTPHLARPLRSALIKSVFPRAIRELAIVLLPDEAAEFSDINAAVS